MQVAWQCTNFMYAKTGSSLGHIHEALADIPWPVERIFYLPSSSHTQLAVTRDMYHLCPRITGTYGGDYKQ
jgi:hypothetical protein